MESTTSKQTHTRALRHYLRVMAFAVLGVICGTVLGTIALVVFPKTAPVPVVEYEDEVATTSPLFARSAPVHLSIPAVALEADFEGPLGLNEDKTVEVPKSFTKIGWYKYGATPGEEGTAVILGHVDSYKGPAIFWPIQKLKDGDEVSITREDGTTAVFVVTNAERYDQDDFPTQKVYGKTDYPSLRLITCTGIYNHGTQRYSHNLVVYATLKDPAETSLDNLVNERTVRDSSAL